MKVIVFGISDLAEQLTYYIDESKDLELAYFCVNKAYLTKDEFMGRKVLSFEDDLDQLSKDEYQFIIAMGYKQLRMRKKVFEDIKAKGFKLANYMHPTVINMGKVEGEGNIILANVVIEPFAKIGNNNIIWTNNLICHDAVIGEHNFIAAASLIGGFSKVLENNFIGFNSTVIHNRVIEKEVLIGAKSLVIKDPENHSTYYGAPAIKISSNNTDGIMII